MLDRWEDNFPQDQQRAFSGVQELMLGIGVWLGGAYQTDAAQTGVKH